MSESATSDFEVGTAEDAGATVVSVSGELDIYTAPQLLEHLTPLLERTRPTVAIDLADVRFIDSSGLGALVNALKQFRQAGGDLVLRAPTESTYKLFEITGLTRVFTIESDRAS